MDLAPLTRRDLPALLRLARAAGPGAGIGHLDGDGLAEQVFGDPDADPAFLLKVERGRGLAGAVAGVLRTAPEGRRAYVKFAATAPAQRRRGVATLLFDALERRFVRRRCLDLRVGGCPPPYLSGGVPVADTPTHCFLLGRGYRRDAAILDMDADLAGFRPAWSGPDIELAEAAGLRAATRADFKALRALVAAEFPYWRWEIESGLKRGVVYVAGAGGTVSAFACAGATHKGWFGPMGTLPSERGRGLGRLLLWKCLESLKRGGVKRARIPWVGPVPFYARHGGAVMGPLFWTFVKPVSPQGGRLP